MKLKNPHAGVTLPRLPPREAGLYLTSVQPACMQNSLTGNCQLSRTLAWGPHAGRRLGEALEGKHLRSQMPPPVAGWGCGVAPVTDGWLPPHCPENQSRSALTRAECPQQEQWAENRSAVYKGKMSI